MIYTPETHPDFKVFVDGIQRYDMNFADDEAGIARGFKQEGNDDNTDPNGRVEFDPSGDGLITVEYRGVVTVERATDDEIAELKR